MAAIPPGISASLRDAIAAGQPNAQYELAMRLFEGRGLPKDQPAAARWFERAASLGLAPAQYRLGSMYEKGIGVTRDPAAAKRWYLKAAEAGNARAAHNLAVMNAEPGDGRAELSRSGEMVPKGGRTRRPRQPVQSRRSFMRAASASKRTSASRCYGSRLPLSRATRTPRKKRDEIAGQMDPAIARLRSRGVDEIQGRQSLIRRQTMSPRRRADGTPRRARLTWPIAAPPTRLTRKRLFDRDVRRRDDPSMRRSRLPVMTSSSLAARTT